MTNIETTAETLARLRAYAETFVEPPAILTLFPSPGSASVPVADRAAPVFPFAPDSDKGLGILLFAAALHRPGARDAGDRLSGGGAGDTAAATPAGFGAEAATLLAALYRDYGNDLFKLNRLPFDPLRARVDAQTAAWDEDDRARIPGILRSVADFFYRVGPLAAWLTGAPDWEQRVGEIAQEIYWMGAQSPTRTKARLFLWLACQAGLAARPEAGALAARFAWPVSDGHMRFLFDIVKPSRAQAAALKRPEIRGEAFAALAREVFPGEPWRLYVPLATFLRPGGAAGFRCRAVQGGCSRCALAPSCPAANGTGSPPRAAFPHVPRMPRQG